MNISVIIPAAGKSNRFGPKDKLAEDLGGRPLLLRTVEFFTKREDIQEIIVAGPENDFPAFQERFGPSLAFHAVIITKGGSTRSITVKNALSKVSESIDIVVVHDAARPAITNALFDALLVACATFPAVAPALPINGTLKRTGSKAESVVDEDAIADSILGADSQTSIKAFKVEETVDRSNLWEIQTPQCFKLSLLKRAYSKEDIENCTDDAQVVEKIGEAVYLINGDSRNIKVTTLEDFKLVKAILGLKGKTERPAHKRF